LQGRRQALGGRCAFHPLGPQPSLGRRIPQ
jgi:hypothetical protein